jgi:hypothetical protein
MSATGVPPWVESANAVLSVSATSTSESPRPFGKASLGPESDDVTLGTHRQEKAHAGFTCAMCPNPKRPTVESGPYYVDYNKREGSRTYYTFTERCRECNTSMKRWTRAKRLDERLQNARRFFPESKLAFVTLTKPNVPDLPSRGTLAEEARLMKKQVANFRRGQRMKRIVLGGIDVVENTIKKDGSWNIHHHGIWVMDGYYEQSDLDQDWGLGRVHIEEVRKPHATLRYLTSYVTKEPIPKVRCLETFKALRGSAYYAIEDYLANPKICDDVEHASDEA